LNQIQSDLEVALAGRNAFQGSYAFQTSFGSAPAPGLTIKNLGQIPLPLQPSDAKRLIGVATQAPFGHGERTVIDKSVRDTWEIEARDIKFANPLWSSWFKTEVLPKVYAELGLAKYQEPPTCELYKLLLYEKGSQ
jgi:hypothetical protein